MALYKNARNSKNGLRAPCMFIRWDERKHADIEAYPAVSCDYNCDHCGWNPDVAADRVERLKGGWRNE